MKLCLKHRLWSSADEFWDGRVVACLEGTCAILLLGCNLRAMVEETVTRVIRFIYIGVMGLMLLGLSTQVVVAAGPDPQLTKTMSPKRPRVGDPARITITATNVGTANADNVVITDPLPDNMSFVGVATTQGTAQFVHSVITVYVGTLAPGQSVTVTNDVVITSEFADDTPFTNCTGLTFHEGTARLACFPVGPAFNPVSVSSPPLLLPVAGDGVEYSAMGLMIIGTICLLVAYILRSR